MLHRPTFWWSPCQPQHNSGYCFSFPTFLYFFFDLPFFSFSKRNYLYRFSKYYISLISGAVLVSCSTKRNCFPFPLIFTPPTAFLHFPFLPPRMAAPTSTVFARHFSAQLPSTDFSPRHVTLKQHYAAPPFKIHSLVPRLPLALKYCTLNPLPPLPLN